MRPESEAELAEIVAGAKGPLVVRGGGTRAFGAPVMGEVVETAALSGVVLHEPGALTLVVKAGTPVAEVEAVLAAEGQRLPFEPMDHRALLGTRGAPTMGGMVAANVSGPRRVQVGACRDFLLGVRFVDGAGRVLKNGGRVMKNVTGYDLVKLMAGSHGTLGVLTELSFKVLAVPQAEVTLVGRGQDAATGVRVLSAALGSPYDVSGAAHLEAGVAEDASQTRVRLEGLAGSVAYRRDALLKGACAGFEVVEGMESAALWREVRDVTPFAAREGAVWRLSVKPSDAPGLTAAVRAQGIAAQAIYDWGGGLIWLLVDEVGDAGATILRQQVAVLGGHATLVRGSEALRRVVPVFQPEPAPVAALTRALRGKFDPRGILNPGLMG
ncbi:glycolate oxidase subunit GlcE [Thalassovita taeanensis]|uniref:Glycolate oxidase FAD binding subunit n=1 Tax=Thalassovita taeanensis TaxID=657014 RepID=A0A1H9IHK9_9RHOB|nr:glycolate oxidase subunit GlcE [Thalassovita taeanensis]SEQ73952.1 glycolate oxidase FAD binding subunit [Thalassovita taeanensis]